MDLVILYKIAFVILSYLFGSIPTAYIFHKIKKGDDIRKYGSGNVGGTNVTRTLGASYGIAVMVIDVIKGFIPILIYYFIFPTDFIFLAVVSVALVLGHDFPIYINFKGGKGIAISYGVILGISCLSFEWGNPVIWQRIMPAIAIIVAWSISFAIFRIISLASLIAAIITPLSFFFTGYPLPIIIASLVWGIMVFITHRENIKRLAKGKEKKIRGKGA